METYLLLYPISQQTETYGSGV